MKIVIATIKSWNIERAKVLQEKYAGIHEIVIYTKKEEFTIENVKVLEPDYILMPHWSYIVPDEITQNWNCVVFHMTDLPYGRGGSPLQNLIVRGYKASPPSIILPLPSRAPIPPPSIPSLPRCRPTPTAPRRMRSSSPSTRMISSTPSPSRRKAGASGWMYPP